MTNNLPLANFEKFAKSHNAVITTWGNSNFRMSWKVNATVTAEFNSHLAMNRMSASGRTLWFYTANVNDATHVMFDYVEQKNYESVSNLHLTGKGSRDLSLRQDVTIDLILNVI